jgi:hypothetical protein
MAAPVTFTTATAVPLVAIAGATDTIKINFYQCLFGGQPSHDY